MVYLKGLRMENVSSKWQQGLGKTRNGLLGRISQAFKGKKLVNESLLEDIEEILIESDVGVETTQQIIENLKQLILEQNDNAEAKVRALLKKEILEIIKNNQNITITEQLRRPHVILVVGVNGTGKTTTIGKMAHLFRRENKKVLLAGADTFRAAAGEQLEVWAKRAGADVVKQSIGADPASVAYDALDAAVARKVDILIVDTAGRLHTKVNLMEELKKIKRVLSKRLESAPHEVLLILDATTGQNGLNQAKIFTHDVGVTGVVLTKLDGTAHGGIVIPIIQRLGIPVKWVGVGEGLDDLIPFDAEAFVEGMLGE